MTGADFDLLRRVDPAVSRETFVALQHLESEIRRWNDRINLVSTPSLSGFWERHIVDCAQLVPIKPDARRWLDLGSGGGLPGLVIAIMIRDKTGAQIDLVESNRKKSTFLTSFSGSMNLPVRVHARRIEEIVDSVGRVDIVTARALAPMRKLVGLSAQWLEDGSTGLFQKGRDYRQEIAQCADVWRFDLLEHKSMIGDGGVILEISNLARIAGAANTNGRN